MEEFKLVEKPNPTKIATKWALIDVLTAIIITYAFEFLNADPNSPLKYIGFVPFIIFLFLAQKEFRDSQKGFMTFGSGFSAGFRFSVFVGLMMAVFIFLYLKVLSPDLFDKSLEASRAQMEAKNMSDAQIEKAMGMAKSWGPLFAAFATAISYPIFGAIVSLIGAAIFKRERTGQDLIDDAIDPTV
ncbi:DUF4199 domain-containing protein [Mucilaginibacter ximonensis]|uniref:DUF4199 domain-containing protein n=1 Tax=Mucilaginibacter ximonensis TaxID=538021 RepID=A0ABW5Y9S1_9SPHI